MPTWGIYRADGTYKGGTGGSSPPPPPPATPVTLTHGSDSHLMGVVARGHTSDSLLFGSPTRAHGSDSVLLDVSSLIHGSDSALMKVFGRVHTCDSILLLVAARPHSSDSALRADRGLPHTSDSILMLPGTRTHGTNSLLSGSPSRSHGCDSALRDELSLLHGSDSVLKGARTRTQTADSLLFGSPARSHGTDSYLLEYNAPPEWDAELTYYVYPSRSITFGSGLPNTPPQIDDADDSTLTIDLGMTYGTLTLASTTGLTFTTGNGIDDATMEFSGSQANINAALDGMVYTADGSSNLDVLVMGALDGANDPVIIEINIIRYATPLNWWTLNDASTSTYGDGGTLNNTLIADSSSLSVNDVPSVLSWFCSRSVDYGNTTHRAYANDNAAYAFGNADCGFSMWMKQNFTTLDGNGLQCYMMQDDGTNTSILYWDGTNVILAFNPGAVTVLSYAWAGDAGNWHHWAWTRRTESGTQYWTLYKDGVSVATSTTSKSIGDAAGAMYIAWSAGGSWTSYNRISNVMFFDRCPDSTEIAAQAAGKLGIF